jgi:formylglycine-generating enzyme required for sulfatase activity
MSFVDTSFCPDIDRKCLDMEHEHPNNLDICHKFAHEESCKTAEEERRFCIDHYEYPNQKGAHPVWMLTWSEAQATCESKKKRLCWASEWTAACEGPEHLPFPYGWERSSAKCNMDNMFINPIKGPYDFRFYSKDDSVRGPELARLDQSMPSGAMPECTNGFGVFDMTGNLDEWVVSDRPPRDKSKWAGLKGGAWGHVRNQCRPMSTSHEPEFYYYFVSFRCCRDAEGFPAWKPDGRNMPAPEVEAHDFAPDAVAPVNPSGPSAKKYSRTGKPE